MYKMLVQEVMTKIQENYRNCTIGKLEIQWQTSNSLFIAWLIAFNKTTSKEKILRHEACKTANMRIKAQNAAWFITSAMLT